MHTWYIYIAYIYIAAKRRTARGFFFVHQQWNNKCQLLRPSFSELIIRGYGNAASAIEAYKAPSPARAARTLSMVIRGQKCEQHDVETAGVWIVSSSGPN